MFEDFKKDNITAWKERVATELKGKQSQDLRWKNEDGIEIDPYFTSENSQRQFPVISSRQETGWDVFEPIHVKDMKRSNTEALLALENGASGLCFYIPGEISPAEISLLLEGIGLPYIQTGFCIRPSDYVGFCLILAEHIRHRGYDPKEVKGFIQADFTRTPVRDLPEALLEFANDSPACAAALKGMRLFVIDAAFYREAGCTAATELGILLSWFREWLDTLSDMGIDYGKVSSLWQVNLGNSGDYFLELSKYRICNFLLSRIASRYGVFRPVYVMGSTAKYNKSLLDPATNLLRSTTEAMSAVSGLSNGLLVHPYTDGEESESGRVHRISRNIQFILQHESHLDLPQDPAAGAYYPEALSFALAEKAWQCFLNIESNGGLAASLRNGFLENSIETSRNRKLEAVKNRKVFQLGVNQFPSSPAWIKDKKPGKAEDTWGSFYQAEPFEDLHRAINQFGEKRGRPAEAVLLTFGDVGMRNARAGFMRNFLGCAGISIREMAWDMQSLPQADLLVLCSSDEEYVTALHSLDAAKGILVLAGNPGDMENTFREAGINYFINARSPLYDTLLKLAEGLGVK